MFEDELFEEFEQQDRISTVDTSNFDEADKLDLQVAESETRKKLNAIEAQREEIGDEDADILIDKARLSLAQKERELISKYKPVPTDEPAPEKPVGYFGKLGDGFNSFNEFTDNLRAEISAPLEPALNLFDQQVRKIGNAIGGTVEDAWNWLTGDDVDVYDKLRELNKEERDKLSKTLDPKGEAVLTPDETAELITEMIPVLKAKSSAEAFAGMEGFLGYARGYDKGGDVGEGITEAGISAGLSLVGGKLAERFFPESAKEVPSDFAKKIAGLGQDDSIAINKVLDNLDANDIKMMNEASRDKLVEQVMARSGSTEEIASNVKAMLKIQKKEAQKAVSDAYDEANKIARETEAVPTTQVLLDTIGNSSGTIDERKAINNIKALVKGKNLNAEDMESVLSDLKSLQRSAKGKGVNTYGNAIESLTKMQKELGGDEIYGQARELSKKFNRDYRGTIAGEGVIGGKQVAKVLKDDIAYQIGEALVGKNVDPNKIGTAVKGLSSGNKMQIVQDILAKGVDDITTPDGVTQFVRNYNAMDKKGLEVLLGKKTAGKLKTNIESIATIESAILDANKIDGGIAREVMDIATAASMASLSPFLAVRSSMFGIKKIINKKALNKQRFELIERVKTIESKPLRNKMTKALSVLLNPDNMDTFKGTEDFNELVKGIEEEQVADDTAKEVEPTIKEDTAPAKQKFTDEDFEAFESQYKEDKPKQEIEWGRRVKDPATGRGKYSTPNLGNPVRPVDINTFTKKLEKVESGGSYTAYNKGSGAYGKYQFIPSTLREYAKKTGQTVSQAKTPSGQDKMFAKFTEDNLNGLKRRGLPQTELALWVAHNQGLGGATAIFKGSKLSDKMKRNIKSNLPKGIEPTAENYLSYWSKKFDG